MRTKKRCERKKMRTKKKMLTKKKEGNEFSLMKFVQMARIGFRNCHTRWFSKKKILGPVMYICSQFCPSFLQKTPTFCISQKKVPYGFFFHLAFRLRSQPQILSNCANLFYLLTSTIHCNKMIPKCDNAYILKGNYYSNAPAYL